MKISDLSNYDYQINTGYDKKNIVANEPSTTPQKDEGLASLPVKLESQIKRPDVSTELDFAFQSKLKTDKVLIGSNSDLESLDIAKAISAYKKDSVLQEYSYFVNDINQEDGFVIKKMGS